MFGCILHLYQSRLAHGAWIETILTRPKYWLTAWLRVISRQAFFIFGVQMVASEEKFTKVLIKTELNGQRAAKKLGCSPTAVYKRLRENPEIRKKILNARELALKRAGLTRVKVYKKLAEGLDSTKVISCNVVAPDGEGMRDAGSMTKDFVDVPDYATRHKYVETALRLHRDLTPDDDDDHRGKVIVNIFRPEPYKTMDIECQLAT